jgi:hypothetical protein
VAELEVSLSFEYSDYHRTIIGYHGTSEEAADRLVAGEAFRPSDHDDEWFGEGIYFWEYAPQQAWWWAKRFKRYQQPAVIGAAIRLGNCLDLLDPANIRGVKEFREQLIAELTALGAEIPQNFRQHRNQDCAVFDFIYRQAMRLKRPLDTARGVYVPTGSRKRAWPGSWIHDEAHIQICVRNPKKILAVWHVREDGGYGKASVSRR